jgi:hypothetical protein
MTSEPVSPAQMVVSPIWEKTGEIPASNNMIVCINLFFKPKCPKW